MHCFPYPTFKPQNTLGSSLGKNHIAYSTRNLPVSHLKVWLGDQKVKATSEAYALAAFAAVNLHFF